jgi:hypothetical protein
MESAQLPRKSQENKRRNPQNLVLHGSKDPQDVVGSGDCVNGSGDNSAKKPAEKPVSLHPLEFEEAVRDLLRVKPKQKQATPAKR